MSRLTKIPPILAVANVHPDYIDICVEGCCTGSRFPCKLPKGTITFLRQTAGGKTTKQYGVVGVWYYSGEARRVHGASLKWPQKWDWQVSFRPIVQRLEKPFCENFSGPVPGSGSSAIKSSIYVPGLTYTKLQGAIVTVPPELAAVYVRALMSETKAELDKSADYLGHEVNGYTLLRQHAKILDSVATRARSKN